jgi:hypothetical protein
MRRRLHSLTVLMLLILGLLTPVAHPAGASTPEGDRPCGRVSFQYSLRHPSPGEVMDMDLGIVNCSGQAEALRLRVRFSGPCEFPHPVHHTYRLDGHFAVGSNSLVLSPSCPGRYSVWLRLTLAGERRVLGTAQDGFTVT